MTEYQIEKIKLCGNTNHTTIKFLKNLPKDVGIEVYGDNYVMTYMGETEHNTILFDIVSNSGRCGGFAVYSKKSNGEGWEWLGWEADDRLSYARTLTPDTKA